MQNRHRIHQLALALWLVAIPAVAQDHLGRICFGPNLAKPLSEHTDRLYLRVDDSAKLYFNRPQDGPVLADLDLHQDYLIKVYFDDRIVQSWTLNFANLDTHRVMIWRSAGAWHMDPAEAAICP
jgi:hypothetical protein